MGKNVLNGMNSGLLSGGLKQPQNRGRKNRFQDVKYI